MIRNAVVKKATPKNTGLSASNTKAFHATTGELLLNNSNVSNVQRLYRPVNNNAQRLPTNSSQRSIRASNDHRLKPANMSRVKEVASKAVDITNAASAAWFIIGVTWILYMIQFVFALMSLIGISAMIAVGESWVGYIDFMDLFSGTAQSMAFVGMGMTAVMGIFTLIASIAIFMFRGVDINKSYSVPIMALCFALNTVPAASLVPWIWVWCLYVVKSQVNKQ